MLIDITFTTLMQTDIKGCATAMVPLFDVNIPLIRENLPLDFDSLDFLKNFFSTRVFGSKYSYRFSSKFLSLAASSFT